MRQKLLVEFMQSYEETVFFENYPHHFNPKFSSKMRKNTAMTDAQGSQAIDTAL